MQLTFRQPYKSIKKFDSVDLPKFTLITGVNGSGKTHLLEAISSGNIQCNLITDPQKEIYLYNFNTLIPNASALSTQDTIKRDQNTALTSATGLKPNFREQIDYFPKYYEIDLARLDGDAWRLLDFKKEELQELLPANKKDQIDRFYTELRSMYEQAKNVFSLGQKGESKAQIEEYLERLEKRFPNKNILNITIEDFEASPCQWHTDNIFEQSFAEIFFSYFDKFRTNQLHRLMAQDGHNQAYLTADKFVALNGPPPWDLVNGIFEKAKLNFQITYPQKVTDHNFMPVLIHNRTKDFIMFESLSSGEKILMCLALSICHIRDSRISFNPPKLLLLDEIDAPLHPSMSRQMMDIIKNVIVEKFGVHVIMTTHSPATVALTDADSVYVLEPQGCQLKKVGKQQAISLLTSEIPTLSIDFEGRRQVFVESEYDAKRYDKLYQIFKKDFQSERSLSFIGLGIDTKVRSGCDAVKDFLENLRKSGNKSVYGLIDWDLKNNPADGLFVLGGQERYGIENFILDPLLIAALTLRDDDKQRAFFDVKSYAALSQIEQTKLQEISTKVQQAVLSKIKGYNAGTSMSCEYLDGLKINIETQYLHHNCHGLEDLVKEAFPCLRAYSQTGALLFEIIAYVINDFPQFCPRPVFDSLKSILEANPD